MKILSRGLRVVLLVGFVLSLAAGVQAAPQDVTITVTTLEDEFNDDDDCSLREAMYAANFNAPKDTCPTGDSIGMDTIVFAYGGTIILGTYLPVYNAGPMTIDGGNQVTVSGNNATNIFTVTNGADLTLRNLTVEAGYLSGTYNNGAALRSEEGIVTIDNCIFQNNSAWSGGAIISSHGSLTITNSSFLNNEAHDYLGGAIYSYADTSRMISNTTFSGNTAPEVGGAIYSVGNSLEIYNSIFQDNVAYYGGAIGLYVTGVTVSDSYFENNMVWGTGGAIHYSGTSCTVEESEFIGNTAWEGGGAIKYYWTIGKIALENGEVISSSEEDAQLYLDGNWFNGNATIGNGGALSIEDAPDFSIVSTTFYSNTALSGGGLYIEDSKGNISDSLFVDNYGDHGGGINNKAIDFANSGLTVERTTLWENSSLQGGAIYNENAHLMLINDTLASNTSDIGGGIYNTAGGFVEILNSTLAHNSAGQSDQLFNDAGAAIYTANSIYAYGVAGYNCLGTITDYGHNIDDSNTCGFSPANGSLPNADPLLGPLQDNGGPGTPGYGTRTFALHYGSPAISSANYSLCPYTDQRGMFRRLYYCDIGAYEAQTYVFYVNSGDWQSTYINSYFPDPLVMEVQDYYGNRLAGVEVTFSGPDAGASIANNYTSLITGADGFVSFDALANGIPGGWYDVVAMDSWHGISTTFHLTNLTLPGEEMYFFLPMLTK